MINRYLNIICQAIDYLHTPLLLNISVKLLTFQVLFRSLPVWWSMLSRVTCLISCGSVCPFCWLCLFCFCNSVRVRRQQLYASCLSQSEWAHTTHSGYTYVRAPESARVPTHTYNMPVELPTQTLPAAASMRSLSVQLDWSAGGAGAGADVDVDLDLSFGYSYSCGRRCSDSVAVSVSVFCSQSQPLSQSQCSLRLSPVLEPTTLSASRGLQSAECRCRKSQLP